MSTQQRKTARAQRTPKTNMADVRRKYEETQRHIDALVREEQALVARTNEVRTGHSQMMGRLRVLAELLGDVPPLPAMPQEPAEANGVQPPAQEE